MMTIIYITLGLLVLVAVAIDICKTIIFMNGAGFISKYLAGRLWDAFFAVSGKKGSSLFLTFAGGTILIVLIFLWVILIWLGFTLIFLSDPDSIINASTKVPTDLVGNIYYVGYTLTSLGNGDLISGSDVWRIVSNILGITSMFFVTVGISYLLPVLQAVVQKRALSVQIFHLGKTPEEILQNGWNGKNFQPLYDELEIIQSNLFLHAERHLAYPILHYFHSNIQEYSAPLQMAKLDEVLTILEVYELNTDENSFKWKFLRGAMDNYISRLETSFIESSSETPQFPYKNFPKYNSAFDNRKKIQTFNKRRCTLLGLIKKDGWDWEDVMSSK